MAWAKAQCMQNNCNENDTLELLRSQLGNLFYEIRFGEMKHQDFQQRYQRYDDLISLEEFRNITMMIANKNFRPANFNRSSRRLRDEKRESQLFEPEPTQQNEIEYKRRGPFTADEDRGRKISIATTKFISTSKLNLKKISCYVDGLLSIKPKFVINAKTRIYKNCSEKSHGTLISYVTYKRHYHQMVFIIFEAVVLLNFPPPLQFKLVLCMKLMLNLIRIVMRCDLRMPFEWMMVRILLDEEKIVNKISLINE